MGVASAKLGDDGFSVAFSTGDGRSTSTSTVGIAGVSLPPSPPITMILGFFFLMFCRGYGEGEGRGRCTPCDRTDSLSNGCLMGVASAKLGDDGFSVAFSMGDERSTVEERTYVCGGGRYLYGLFPPTWAPLSIVNAL